jgi:methylenetetrahydrofolate reductase (NADPH)
MIDQPIVEILTPRQNCDQFDAELEKFADKYRTVIENGYVVSVPDNPMGNLHFQATEVVGELGLPVPPGQLLLHLNTFHTKSHLDEILSLADRMGVRYLLLISGDGSERLPRLQPEAINTDSHVVTSVELLRYVHSAYPGRFVCGMAFNPYEPPDHETEKLRRKIEAGASFVITQPVLGKNERVDAIESCGLPLFLDAWMSRKLHLLSECVGYEIPEDTPYDPIENLKALRRHYPRHGLYLALLGFKTQLPLLATVLAPPA